MSRTRMGILGFAIGWALFWLMVVTSAHAQFQPSVNWRVCPHLSSLERELAMGARCSMAMTTTTTLPAVIFFQSADETLSCSCERVEDGLTNCRCRVGLER